MKLLSITCALAVLALAAGSVHAVELDLPGEEQRIEASYSCGDTLLDVEFINVGDNSLALIAIDGAAPLVFASVVAASGARYIGGVYEFWDHGGEASFAASGSDPVQCRQT